MAQYSKRTNNYLTHAKTLFEVVMIADQNGNPTSVNNPTGTAVDAFGRMRVSNPVTLFDSFNRYQINSHFSTLTSVSGGSISYNEFDSSILLNVDTSSGSFVKRETTRVFAYQPGKSLQILATFCFDVAQSGLRQRVGYFNDNNGVFLEQDNSVISFVIRSSVSGSVSDLNRVAKADWNIDKLDGTGPSGKTLDLTTAQIFWTDIEWLGVGSVRCGFVIDGQFVHCHTFHHANHIESTYMTTACLPIRYEIQNTANTSVSSSLRQICCSVISEGGYELRGRNKSAGSSSLINLPTAGTFYNLMSIRLKVDRLDAIVVPKNISVFGKGNNTRIHWKILSGGTITGGSWNSAGSDSAVEYNNTGTLTGGSSLVEGYIGIDAQSSQTASLDSGMFKFQLERNGLTGQSVIFTLAATGGVDDDKALGAMVWEEIT